MPYVPRPATTVKCAHCKNPFQSHHASRKYCSNSCNVLASYERTGYRGEPRASRADLERTLTKMMEMMKIKPELTTSKPTTTKPATKAAAKSANLKPAAKPAIPKPAAKAAAKKPATKAIVETPHQMDKPAKKSAKQPHKAKKPAVRVLYL